METYALAVYYPIDPAKHSQVLASLQAAAPTNSSQASAPLKVSLADLTLLTARQQEIADALLAPKMNDSQVRVLQVHLQNYRAAGPHVPAETVADRLLEDSLAESSNRELVINKVKGALRSFGKRLNRTLTGHIPCRIGVDRKGEGVADEIPLLAMFSLHKDNFGRMCHRLTEDGAVAVAQVLGSNLAGVAASNPMPQAGNEDQEEIVGLAMTRLSAALIERVAQSLGMTRDEAIRHMTAQCGAG